MSTVRAVVFGLWLSCAAIGAHAQAALQFVGAMVEGPGGTPLATAFGIYSDGKNAIYVTDRSIVEMDGACVRTWDQGNCQLVARERSVEVRNLPGLSVVSTHYDHDDMLKKFASIRLNETLAVGSLDIDRDARRVKFLTQNRLGGWEIPVDPAPVVGRANGGFTVKSASLSSLSVGAPVAHSEKGLVGVIAAVDTASGVARVVDMTTLVDALVAGGVPVPPEMRPKNGPDGELPRAVENEMGRLFVFQDNSSIPAGLSGFYGPSSGAGFDANFVTSIDYSVYGIDAGGPSGTLLAKGAKAVPLTPTGMPLEAPFKGTPPDLVATCVVHTTPSSSNRPVLVMNFWRAVPERFNPHGGSKSYDEAAPPLTGWADGRSPCLARLARLDKKRIAALTGQARPSAAIAVKDEPWHWSTMHGPSVNVSGFSGTRRVNIFCFKNRDRLSAGVALLGSILEPLTNVDVRKGRLIFEVGEKRHAAALMRSDKDLSVRQMPDGRALLAALKSAPSVSLTWKDGNGTVPLGTIPLAAAKTHLAEQRAECGIDEAAVNRSSAVAWERSERWTVTGRPAFSTSVKPNRTLLIGCTESRELLVALYPSAAAKNFLIGDLKPHEEGVSQDMAFGFFSSRAAQQIASGANISFGVAGDATDVRGPPAFASSAAGKACSG